MSGGDVGTLLYALLVLAVPFLFGVVVGRGVRRPEGRWRFFRRKTGVRCAL